MSVIKQSEFLISIKDVITRLLPTSIVRNIRGQEGRFNLHFDIVINALGSKVFASVRRCV